jgi:hypothetical protein
MQELTKDFKVTQWDLMTYSGVAAAVVMLVFGLTVFFPNLTKGREPLFSLFLTYALGITSKLTIKGSFANVHWLVYLVTLFGVALSAKVLYDHSKDILGGIFGLRVSAGDKGTSKRDGGSPPPQGTPGDGRNQPPPGPGTGPG